MNKSFKENFQKIFFLAMAAWGFASWRMTGSTFPLVMAILLMSTVFIMVLCDFAISLLDRKIRKMREDDEDGRGE